MSILEEWQSSDWRGTPCTSDAWPYSPDVALFEARRAIGQLVRTFGDGVNPSGLEPAEVDPVLSYIRAAHELEAIMHAVQKDLVAEARVRGLTWEVIGHSLGIRRAAAHRRFHRGLSKRRLDQLRNEAFVSWMARQAVRMPQPPEQVATDLDGATPLERLVYFIRQGYHVLDNVDALMALAESDSDSAMGVLEIECRRIERTLRTVALDRVMWEAMAGWSHQVGTADQVNFYAPTTYLLYVMRLLLWALLNAPEVGSADINQFRAFLVVVRQVYATALLIFERPDVGGSIPAPE